MLASLVIIPLIGERVIKSYLIAIAATIISLVTSIIFSVAYFGTSIVESFPWIGSAFSLSLIGSNLTLTSAVLVSFVSLMVLLFSVFYMKKEPQERYYTEMSLFIASMLGLVLSGSLLLFYIFWELVGVSSYLLIGFWYKKERAVAAGKKALVMTRIGDVAFLAALAVIFINLNTFSISTILQSLTNLSQPLLLLISSLIIIAALSKSAQFPFYTWLPDAMEGPTPVSALLHSATMVAAGAYLLILLSPLITAAGLDIIITIVGLLTAFLAALLALNNTHFKRILAYSTIESLAFMFMAIGTVNTAGAMFYLITHALFKSLLFFVSGVLAVTLGIQDIYALRSKRLLSSWLSIPAAIGFASLAGLPPFMSFFAHASLTIGFNLYESILFVIIAFLTALFSFRAFFLIFNKRSNQKIEMRFSAAIPIYILASLSAAGGAIVIVFNRVLLNFAYSIDIFTLATIMSTIIGIVIAYELFYLNRIDKLYSIRHITDKLISRISYDSLITDVGNLVVHMGNVVAKFDALMSRFYEGSAYTALFMSSKSRKLENGDTHSYIIAILIGAIAILAVATVFI
jgi:NADH-quinone oxidoreductase subunit L